MKFSIFNITAFFMFAFVLVISTSLFKEKNKDIQSTKKIASEEITRAAKHLDQILSNLKHEGHIFVNDYESGKIKKYAINKRLENIIKNNENVYAVGIAFNEYSYSRQKKLYAPYFIRKLKKIKLFDKNDNGKSYEFIKIEDIYNYTKDKYFWYHIPQKIMHGIWIEPKHNEIRKNILSSYSIPLRDTNNTIIGTFIIEYPIDNLNGFMKSLNMGKDGYGMIVSEDGKVIYHRNKKVVKSEKTIDELDEISIEKILNLVAISKKEVIDNIKEKMWIFNEPIKCTHWNMQMFYFKKEAEVDKKSIRTKTIWVGIFSLISMSFFALHFFKGNYFTL